MKLGLILILNLFIFSLCYAFAPQLKQKYDSETAINEEFRNVYSNLDNFTFKVVNSSPVYVSTGTSNIDNGQIIIYSSNTFTSMFIRINNLLFYQELKLKQ